MQAIRGGENHALRPSGSPRSGRLPSTRRSTDGRTGTAARRGHRGTRRGPQPVRRGTRRRGPPGGPTGSEPTPRPVRAAGHLRRAGPAESGSTRQEVSDRRTARTAACASPTAAARRTGLLAHPEPGPPGSGATASGPASGRPPVPKRCPVGRPRGDRICRGDRRPGVLSGEAHPSAQGVAAPRGDRRAPGGRTSVTAPDRQAAPPDRQGARRARRTYCGPLPCGSGPRAMRPVSRRRCPVRRPR